jgi:hypothetical protein
MFAFPVGAASNLVRNNIQSQVSIFLNLYKSFANTSMQLGELNVQATRKLMEESTSALSKCMQLRTLADTQSFFTEQSQVTIDRICGYALNVQNIVTENALDLGMPHGASAAQRSVRPGDTHKRPAQKDAASHGQHEIDQPPSALAGKLGASVVSDSNKLH